MSMILLVLSLFDYYSTSHLVSLLVQAMGQLVMAHGHASDASKR